MAERGPSATSQGVSKAGNPRLRATLVEMAWLWLRHQPGSALARWYHDRVQRNGGRLKKVAIVALARKLLVALWKHVTTGVVIGKRPAAPLSGYAASTVWRA